MMKIKWSTLKTVLTRNTVAHHNNNAFHMHSGPWRKLVNCGFGYPVNVNRLRTSRMLSQCWTVNSNNWCCWCFLLVYDSSFIKNKGCNMILCCSLRWISPYKSKHWYKYATTTGGNKKGIPLLRRNDCIIAPIIVGAMIYHFRNSISILVVKSCCWRTFLPSSVS